MEVSKVKLSEDGKTKKYIMATEDGFVVEALYVDYPNKNIVCFSTEIGCPIQCIICSAGKYIRDLKCHELIDQCKLVCQDIKNDKPILLSAMGVGEPILNWDNIMSFMILYFFDDFAKGKKDRYRFAFSTMLHSYSSFTRALSQLVEYKIYPKIQISLHSCYDPVRQRIFNNKSLAMEDVRRAAKVAKKYGFEVEFNYCLIENFNDASHFDALELSFLYHETKIPIKLNKFNNVNDVCRCALQGRVDSFVKVLRENNVEFEIYETNGYDIKGACGQLLGGRYRL